MSVDLVQFVNIEGAVVDAPGVLLALVFREHRIRLPEFRNIPMDARFHIVIRMVPAHCADSSNTLAIQLEATRQAVKVDVVFLIWYSLWLTIRTSLT